MTSILEFKIWAENFDWDNLIKLKQKKKSNWKRKGKYIENNTQNQIFSLVIWKSRTPPIKQSNAINKA